MRYLVLDGSDLRVSYYESRTAFQSGSASPKGEFFLSSVEKHAYSVGMGGQDKPFGFKMVGHAPGKGFTELDVYVDTLADLNKWLEIAHNALERANNSPRAKLLADSVASAGVVNARSIFGFRLGNGSTSPVAALAASSPEQQIKTLGGTKQVLLTDALKELEGAKLIGREACNEIVVQGQKLDNVEANLGAIEGDLDFGDKLLRRMKRPMLHVLARDLQRPQASPSKPSNAYLSGVEAGSEFTVGLGPAAIQVDAVGGEGGELERLARALGELEAQATLMGAEAVKSTEQIARIEQKLTAVNARVQKQTKQATTSIQRGNIF